jgi:thiol-disulfide isomerase/thioredoxin
MLRLLPLLAAHLICGAVSPAADDGPGFDGTWRLVVYPAGWTVCSVEVDTHRSPVSVSLSSLDDAFDRDKSSVQSPRLDGNALHFDLKLVHKRGPSYLRSVAVYQHRGAGAPRILLGSYGSRDEVLFPAEFIQRSPGIGPIEPSPHERGPEWPTLGQAGLDERMAVFEQFAAKYPEHPRTYSALAARLLFITQRGKPEAELRGVAERLVRLSKRYGREMELFSTHWAAWSIAESNAPAPVAIEYARRAEALLRPEDPPAVAEAVLRTLAWSLRRLDGKGDATLAARIAGTADRADRALTVADSAFLPAVTRERPRSKGHTVLVEMFTGTRCPPCVAADVAFDALVEQFDRADVVAIQYHLPIPGYDLLTNPSAAARFEFYKLRGVPMMRVDGQAGPDIGGPITAAKEGYAGLRKAVEPRLDEKLSAAIDLKVERRGDILEVRSKIDQQAPAKHPLRLRFALVEEIVHYAGDNGRRVHHNVVRAMPGGVEGVPIDAKTFEHSLTIDLTKTVRELEAAIAAQSGEKSQRRYPDNYHVTGFGRLALVAFVQEDETCAVLQTRWMSIP